MAKNGNGSVGPTVGRLTGNGKRKKTSTNNCNCPPPPPATCTIPLISVYGGSLINPPYQACNDSSPFALRELVARGYNAPPAREVIGEDTIAAGGTALVTLNSATAGEKLLFSMVNIEFNALNINTNPIITTFTLSGVNEDRSIYFSGNWQIKPSARVYGVNLVLATLLDNEAYPSACMLENATTLLPIGSVVADATTSITTLAATTATSTFACTVVGGTVDASVTARAFGATSPQVTEFLASLQGV